MRLLRLIPDGTNFDFVGHRYIAFAITGLLMLAAAVSLGTQGFKLGIDFKGGILIEARAEQTVDVAKLRAEVESLNLGEVEIQQFGSPNDVLIRVQQQAGGDDAQMQAVDAIKAKLGTGYEYRRTESVGPRVGKELLRKGVMAAIFAVLGIAVYVAFRFEWQFGLAAFAATAHDVFTTAGIFSIFQLEFNMTGVAALLLLAGYSVNDTVVVFDRIRETMKKDRRADLKTIINESVNRTLSRTVLTATTVVLSVIPLILFGGDTLLNFSIAIAWGVLIGTYSSIFVASCLLLYLPPVRKIRGGDRVEDAAPAA